MSEIRQIDAEALRQEILCLQTYKLYVGGDRMIEVADAIKTIAEAPTVSAVPLVRCKDCAFTDPATDVNGVPNVVFCKTHIAYMAGMGYCHLGKERSK